MKFKTTVLLSVLTRGNYCHSQCKGLVNMADTKSSPKMMCCFIFSENLEINDADTLRGQECLSAQKAAIRDCGKG